MALNHVSLGSSPRVSADVPLGNGSPRGFEPRCLGSNPSGSTQWWRDAPLSYMARRRVVGNMPVTNLAYGVRGRMVMHLSVEQVYEGSIPSGYPALIP
jgi:hypothetical protein